MRKPRWTPEQEHLLRTLYPSVPLDVLLSAFPGFKKQRIYDKAQHMGLVRADLPRPWSPEEDERLRAMYLGASHDEVEAAFPGRTWIAVNFRAKKLGLKRRDQGVPWTAEEEDRLRALYTAAAPEGLLEAFPGRSLSSIYGHGWQLGLRRPMERQPWTAEDDAKLQTLYATASWEALFEALPGRSKESIAQRGGVLFGIRRKRQWTPEGLAAHKRAMTEKPRRTGYTSRPHSIVDGEEGKTCRICATWRPLKYFGKSRSCAGGRRHECTTCEGRLAYARNPEACIASTRRTQKKYPERTRARVRRATAKFRGAELADRVTHEDIAELVARFNGLCVYCKVAPYEHIDHRIPICRGGKDELKNLAPACRRCNLTKGRLTDEEFMVKLRLEMEK